MLRRFQALRQQDSGVALIMVLGWTLVLATLVTGALGYAIATAKTARKGQDWGSAEAAAMAGIEDYVARLNRNDNYARIWDCTNNALKGPNEPGNTCGWTATTTPGWLPVVGSDLTGPTFHYDVDASLLDKSGTVTVTSTGRVGNTVRTVEAAVGRGGSTDFLYYTDLEDADPANTTAYPTAPTKYMCGASGAQKDIYWYSPASGGYTRSTAGCVEIGFAGTDVLDGRVHFNDTPKLNASGTTFLDGFETADPKCKNAIGTYAQRSTWSNCLRSSTYTPVYGDGTSTGSVPPSYSDALYLDDTSAKFANYPGCHYYGATRIKFNSDGTMTVWSKESAGKTLSTTGFSCGTFTSANNPQTVAVPADAVIYASASGASVRKCLSGEIGDGLPLGTYTGSTTTQYTYDDTMLTNDQFCGQGNLYIEGTVKGRVTVASENSIVATGDLVLASGINGTDMLGLVAGNSVEVFHPWINTWYKNGSNVWGWKNNQVEDNSWPHRYVDPSTGGYNPSDGIQISGSIQTLQHSFWVQQYGNGSVQGTLLVQGSIAQRWRGIVGTGSISTGYSKNYRYDARLKYSSPPYFPQWTNAKWGPRHTGELVSPYNAAGAYVGS